MPPRGRARRVHSLPGPPDTADRRRLELREGAPARQWRTVEWVGVVEMEPVAARPPHPTSPGTPEWTAAVPGESAAAADRARRPWDSRSRPSASAIRLPRSVPQLLARAPATSASAAPAWDCFPPHLHPLPL